VSGSGFDKTAPAWTPRVFQSCLDPSWIDYNGHLRDAYYTLIASACIDALMDDIGIDAAYRRESHCTLYTVELHVRYLREIKDDGPVFSHQYLVDCDAKRMRVLLALRTGGSPDPAAVVDVMLLHVHQGTTVSSAPFPEAIQARLAAWRSLRVSEALIALGSRPLLLGRKP
jgi:acyl-CoA thioester hydrolase